MDAETTRRGFLRGTGALAAPLLLAGCASTGKKKDDTRPADVSPAERLMREHGVVDRILLIYEEGARRLESGDDAKPAVIGRSAKIIRRFIEEGHERLEEDHVFPVFEKAEKLVDLVTVLRKQHIAGREVTAEIEKLAAGGAKSTESAAALAANLRAFVRMYRPHEAREDTVILPAFRALLTEREWDDLGDVLRDKEYALFGDRGFESVVVEVEAFEHEYGIEDLSKLTAR
jgi:hemerythrin-like domain-containing protein